MIINAEFNEDNKVLNANFGQVNEVNFKPADQTYNPESENAQSGKAVAEAIASIPSGGATDETYKSVTTFAELQSALTNGYKHIIVGADFEIAKQVEVPEGVTIIGNGHTIKRADNFQTVNAYNHTATEMAMFNVQANFHLEDLTIDGNRENCKDPSWELTHEITLHGNALINNINIINGNECIIAFGDDNVIQNSTFTNCSGNAIHFSGGKRTRILNNTIKNTNLLGDTLGHKGGCISWSAECEDVTAIGNWLENGYAGFGFIGGADNSRLKIIGNTIKNCEYAIDAIFTTLNPVKDVIVQSNNFIDSKAVIFSITDNKVAGKINGIIEGNNFKNTGVSLDNVVGFVVTNNIFDEKTELATACISCTNASRITISDNHCVTQSNVGIGVYLDSCTNVLVSHNYVRVVRYSIYANFACSHITVDGNICRMIYASNRTNEYFLPIAGKNINIINNEIVTYGRGCDIPSYSTVLNNRLLMIDTSKPSFRVGDEQTNIISKNNRTNGTFWTTTNTEKKIVVADNNIGVFDDVFVNLTMNLTNLTSSDVPIKVTKGDEFVFTLIPNEGYSLPESITITNNGINCIISDFEYDKATGEVVLYSVVGDVVVTANA